VRSPVRHKNAITNAIGYAVFHSRSHNAVIRVFDEAANVIETHEQVGRILYHADSEASFATKRRNLLILVCLDADS
jgi:hypothetical protein